MYMSNTEISRASDMLDLALYLLDTANIYNICTTLNFTDACWCVVKLQLPKFVYALVCK